MANKKKKQTSKQKLNMKNKTKKLTPPSLAANSKYFDKTW